MSAVAPLRRSAAPDSASAWRERSGRLYEELRRPARALVHRAFRGAFGDEEIEDIYSSAWLGTLRALERRHDQLTDEEIRKYLLTAVAHHASKELRRRRRKPTAPLDGVHTLADDGAPPDERAAKLEESRITRDLLTTLPPRRRAVMLLRYGWGLEPMQVCGLVKGLSARAYRKEITRGVDELTEKLRLVERGEWCSDREPVLKAYASGLANAEQERQAQQHLSHCRHCSDFVGRLSGHLHDVGSSLAVPSAVDALHDGHLSLPGQIGEAVRRIRESTSNALGDRLAGNNGSEGVVQTASISGSARGAGAAGSGALAKLAGLGTAGKLAAVCLGGSAAATACLAAGIVPTRLPGAESGQTGPVVAHTGERALPPLDPGAPVVDLAPEVPQDASSSDSPVGEQPASDPAPTTTTTTPTQTVETTPIAPTAPAPQQEFGVASAAPTTSSPSGSSTSTAGGGGGSAVTQEFGP
jgi:RNA polymerase sigma factor (sigma-70 family)